MLTSEHPLGAPRETPVHALSIAPTSHRSFTDARDASSLLDALRERRPDAPRLLFDRYHRFVRRVLMRVVGLDAELDDLQHDVFVQIYRSIHSVNEPSSLRAWIASVAVLVGRSELRRRGRRRWLRFVAPESLPDLSPGALESVDPEARHAVRATLATMPGPERELLAQRHVEGFELPEIARASGVSLSTVKRRLARAEARFDRLRDPSAGVRVTERA